MLKDYLSGFKADRGRSFLHSKLDLGVNFIGFGKISNVKPDRLVIN